MTGRYDHLSHEALIGLLERRDVLQRYGLIWEREGIEPDRALNQDYVVFDLDQELSTPPQDARGWRNLVIEGDNWDALRALRLTHAGRIRHTRPVSVDGVATARSCNGWTFWHLERDGKLVALDVLREGAGNREESCLPNQEQARRHTVVWKCR